MRDLIVTLVVFGSLPFIFKKPYIGILMWVWVSVMNPHRLAWGFANTFPFAAIIAATVLMSLFFSKAPKKLPLTPWTWTFVAFVLWINVSTLFALYPEMVYDQWNRVMKIMLMIGVALMILKTQRHIHLLILTLVVSLGFYGVKGGIFTVLSGGHYRVWGPVDSFIDGNNEIALALVMTIPLMHYLQLVSHNKWVRRGLTIAMLLCALAAIGSYSRGALLAIFAMGGFLWIKSKKKLALGMLILMVIPFLIIFMPEKWGERMDTISTYQEDSSAMGRIDAWRMAINLANDRPLVGGGFEIWNGQTFQRYAPGRDARAAHSIYFQALGEHGYVGLGLYLLLGFLTWRTGTSIIRSSTGREDLKWASDLARMIQVSIVGFAVGGAFLSLLYFDVPYYLMVAMVATRGLVSGKVNDDIRPVRAPTTGSSATSF
jgi:putative inorganic carbon (HCO3(-)) transporter